MHSKEIKRYRILDALFEKKHLTLEEMQDLGQIYNYAFKDEFLWHTRKVNGFKYYELSEHGYETYKYLKLKKLKEFLIRVLIFIIGTLIIYYVDTRL